jgi:xanthine dehydrogenase accessory factor
MHSPGMQLHDKDQHTRAGSWGSTGASRIRGRNPTPMKTIIVRGSGDVGSAVAHLLFSSGFSVVIHYDAQPAHTRRRMDFTDGIFARTAELEHVLGKRATLPEDVPRMFRCRRALPVSAAEFQVLADAVQPDVIVDARMRKREQPEVQPGAARLTVGLEPNSARASLLTL